MSKAFKLVRLKKCPACNGEGKVLHDSKKDCKMCLGFGKIRIAIKPDGSYGEEK